MAEQGGASFRVLAIDGGGVRGLIPAQIVAAIEQAARTSADNLFDGFAGTSTGSIVALGLTRPSAAGGPMSGSDLVEIYKRLAPAVFKKRYRTLPQSPIKLRPYARDPLSRLLRHHFNDAFFEESQKPTLVPAYDFGRRRPHWFESWSNLREGGFSCVEVMLASAAAPMYFDPYFLKNRPGRSRFTFIDGGVFANNPAAHAVKRFSAIAGDRPIKVVSIGTGDSRSMGGKEEREWNIRDWIPGIVPTVLDANSDAVDGLMEGGDYTRLQIDLPSGSGALDDASPTALQRLEQAARDYCDTEKRELQRLVASLMGERTK